MTLLKSITLFTLSVTLLGQAAANDRVIQQKALDMALENIVVENYAGLAPSFAYDWLLFSGKAQSCGAGAGQRFESLSSQLHWGAVSSDNGVPDKNLTHEELKKLRALIIDFNKEHRTVAEKLPTLEQEPIFLEALKNELEKAKTRIAKVNDEIRVLLTGSSVGHIFDQKGPTTIQTDITESQDIRYGIAKDGSWNQIHFVEVKNRRSGSFYLESTEKEALLAKMAVLKKRHDDFSEIHSKIDAFATRENARRAKNEIQEQVKKVNEMAGLEGPQKLTSMQEHFRSCDYTETFYLPKVESNH